MFSFQSYVHVGVTIILIYNVYVSELGRRKER